jgi:putative hemolysin
MSALLVIALFLLLASALISAAETAAFTPSDSQVRTLVDEGFRGADSLLRVRDDAEATHLTLRVLETLLDIGVTAVIVYIGVTDWGRFGLAASILGAVLLVLVLGEVVPRALARRRPVRLALASAGTLLRMQRTLRPLVLPIYQLEQRIVGTREKEEEKADEERLLEQIADLGRKEGVVGEEENQLVERAFRLDELSVWDIMTPRVDIFSWKDSLTLEEIVSELSTVPYSRVPVYGESVDDITGILYVREAYQTYVSGNAQARLKDIAREPIFIPGSLSLTRCLRLFQIRRIHMGIVADEFGGTDGLVTLEDVVEELVGEIEDETDLPEIALVSVSDEEILAEGSVDLREVNQALGLSLPLEEHRSLNGLILEELGRVPTVGETLQLEGLEVEVMEASETQMLRARLRKVEPSRSSEEGD